LQDAGFVIVVVTNQSGIARGLLSWDQYHAVAARVEQLLAAAGAHIDATYVCPHYPGVTGPCECRKPGLKFFNDAGTTLDLDLNRSIWVGDRLHDVEPARALGGRGYLVLTGDGPAHAESARTLGFEIAGDLGEVASLVTMGKGKGERGSGRGTH